ncbi:hypothetical protein DND132_1187 [Pseudodesulfovibrio mercurii]|uniref:Glycoside hydrolase 123 N-terminal domain-containing protein n=1 Tax=Pseudodesulfovibrio mercurii TaxID=641491 RepID=F0JCA1_9BACT|nr:glycoside hydrolase domain-containing protein [Pseudodesulfovibrio mercurii]EGB14399.1 hypothetical protein DND132_1187 [Pseudodesulfovibrio mercurii]
MKRVYCAILVVLSIVAWGVNARAGSITAVWVNNGEDKVVKDELRATNGRDVRNSVWDGKVVHLFAARDEVIDFNAVIESAGGEAGDVRVSMSDLVSDNGGRISSRKAEGDGVFDYRGRNIELFFVRYLKITGLSQLAYTPTYDERHVPEKLQLPYSLPKGKSKGRFADRPNANKFYPDIAEPLEAVGAFSIPKGENQAVWVDIYVPRDAEPGVYKGGLRIEERGGNPVELPVELEVLPLDLPDTYNARTMVWINCEDVYERFTGIRWRDAGVVTPEKREIMDTAWYRYFQMAKRHRIHLITDGMELFYKEQFSRLDKVYDGKLFTAEHAYEGPGYGMPSDVYSVGTYGGWGTLKRKWDRYSKDSMWKNTDKVVKFFKKNYPDVECFLYLKDEPHGEKAYAEVEKWARWVKENPGPGRELQTLCTVSLPRKQRYMPSVDIAFELWGQTDVYEKALAKLKAENGKVMSYNGWRPSAGTFMIEDDGVALRVNGWIQFKHNIDRWFYWAGTNYSNPSFTKFRVNVFKEACTFGRRKSEPHPKYGAWGNGYGNGDGLLFYPGTDTVYPEESCNLLGPIASLRLKLWRRGLQDYEYLRMARAVDPEAVDALVRKMVPKSLWELGVTDKSDPTYVHGGISWSVNPDDWERARRELADIAMGGKK